MKTLRTNALSRTSLHKRVSRRAAVGGAGLAAIGVAGAGHAAAQKATPVSPGVVMPGHPLLKLKKPRLADLAAHPAVLPDEQTYTHRIVKEALQAHGVQPRIRLATNYLETLKMLVAIGLGWSVLPRSMLDDTIAPLAIPELAMRRDLGVVWHERRTLSVSARALLAQLRAG